MLYSIKRALLKPYVWIQRTRHKDDSPIGIEIIKVYEVYSYSPNIKRFVQDTAKHQPLLNHELSSDSTVFDVGGFTGDWSGKIHQRYNSTIHIFELLPNYISQLEQKFSGNPKIVIHPYGLLDIDTTESMEINGPGSSLYRGKKGERGQPRLTQVQLRDIKGVMDEIKLNNIDLLSINIEGAEFPLLKRMIEADLIKRFEHIMIQYHEFAPHAHWQRYRINKALMKTHTRVWNYPFIWEKWSRH